MILLDSLQKKEITTFPGADLLRDTEDLHKNADVGAVLARNVEYRPGQVRTRRGFGLYQTISIEATRMFNWIVGNFNRLLYFSTNGGSPKVSFQGLDPGIALDDVVTGLDGDSADAVFAPFGSRLFMAFLDAAGDGIDTARVWNGLFDGGNPIVDSVFQQPVDEGGSSGEFGTGYAEPGAGVVTAGEHNFAVVFRTRNGYQTKAVELSSAFTSAGNMNLTVTLTPVSTWPAWVNGVRLAMTTVQNPELYIFTAAFSTIVGGTSSPIVITVNLDDTTLAALTDTSEATDWFSLIDNGDAEAPDTPVSIAAYGNRMSWIADVLDTEILANVSAIYISNPDEPQWITADRHLVFLPERRKARAQFVLFNLLYVLGPSWTFAFADNGDFPATWARPTQIDNRIGALSQHGVTVNTSRGVAWVANRDGLYAFQGGAFPQLPSSYRAQPDWERINWTNPTQVQVIDDGINDTVRVIAPLDSATEPSHILSFDYKAGVNWWQVEYSLDDIDSFEPGCGEVVLNPSTNASEFMVGDASTAGLVLRQMSALYGDSTLYNDNSAGIDSVYRTTPLPGHAHVPLQHRALHLRIGGSAAADPNHIALTVYNANQSRSVALASIESLSTEDPEADFLRYFRMESESVSVEVTNAAAANRYFILSRAIAYFTGWLGKR